MATNLQHTILVISFIVSFYLLWTGAAVTRRASASAFSSSVGLTMRSQEVQESISPTPLFQVELIQGFVDLLQSWMPNLLRLKSSTSLPSSTAEELACKSVSKKKLRSAVDIEDVRREVEIMKYLLKHANIVSLKDTYEDDNAVHLVMELCEGGELFDRIVARGHYSERAAAVVTRTIVEVVQMCHKHGVTIFAGPSVEIDGFRSGEATGGDDSAFQIWRSYQSILKCRSGELQNRFTSVHSSLSVQSSLSSVQSSLSVQSSKMSNLCSSISIFVGSSSTTAVLQPIFVKESVLPICDDILAFDWVADLDRPVAPLAGAAMRVTFLKLKEGLGDAEKGQVLGVVESVIVVDFVIPLSHTALDASIDRIHGLEVIAPISQTSISDVIVADYVIPPLHTALDASIDRIHGLEVVAPISQTSIFDRAHSQGFVASLSQYLLMPLILRDAILRFHNNGFSIIYLALWINELVHLKKVGVFAANDELIFDGGILTPDIDGGILKWFQIWRALFDSGTLSPFQIWRDA